MQLFKFIVVTKEGKTQIGYMEAEQSDNVRAHFAQLEVRSILSITAARIENVALMLEKRKLFSFTAQTADGAKIFGSIEHLSALDAYRELVENYRFTVFYIGEGSFSSPEQLVVFSEETEIVKKRYFALLKNRPSASNENLFSTAHSLLDREVRESSKELHSQIKDLAVDPRFQADIQNIAATLDTIIQKNDTSLTQYYHAFAYILKELSIIEEALDETPLKAQLKTVLGDVVHLLKKIEKAELEHSKRKDGGKLVDAYISTQTISTEAKDTLKTNVAKFFQQPSDTQFGTLRNSYNEYQEKKSRVKTLESALLEQVEKNEAALEDKGSDITFGHVLLTEVPKITLLLVIFYLGIAVLGEGILKMEPSLNLTQTGFKQAAAALVLHPLFLKILLYLLFFHGVLQISQQLHVGKKTLFPLLILFFLLGGAIISIV